MKPPSVDTHWQALALDLDWLAARLDARIKAHFGDGTAVALPTAPTLPPASAWGAWVAELGLSIEQRLLLLLGLVPHVRPSLLDVLFAQNQTTGRGFSEFGGAQVAQHGGFIPTGETAAFLLAGDALAARMRVQAMLAADGQLARENLLHLLPVQPPQPRLAGALWLPPEALARICGDAHPEPSYGADFPARRLQTALDWQDLVLPQAVLTQLEDLRLWVTHRHTLLADWGMAARYRPGYTALFHGPSGTGKTLTAALLGKLCGAAVYRIDLSLIVSKYIGETEKNLARVFDLAETRGWILFFDEADALFGKRTKVEDAHDRYANQEVSFLLQRIEDFSGVVLLASNLKSNIDDAFLRRFASVIAFPMPRAAERMRLWAESIPKALTLADTVDLAALAEAHEVTGGVIANVVRYACLQAAARGTTALSGDDLEAGLKREYLKEGRAR